ncbi:hypothetical protein KC19_11G090600 [Ceratodon purpureus]|uniref:Transcription factor 25 n=1 Tax=Ceratodon purpureus TaxID=3225 RepID=A0A8T0GEL8_CERPU|nr:hypothetical protein KC19_11G090600 [Ceratodon purpureus]
MSARMLRRALKEQETQQLSKVEGSTDDEEEDEFPTEKPARNLFEHLGSEETDDDEEEEDADDVNIQDEGEVLNSTKSQILKKGVLTANLGKSKKKKNKGKRKEKTTVESSPAIEEESVDEMLERLVRQNEESASTSDPLIVPDIDPFEILGVDPRYLRAEDELRRIFGSKVINAVEKGGDGAGMLAGRRRQQPHGGGRVSSKKTLLVSPHDHWPRPEGGLSMECIDTKDGLNFFRYSFSSSYQEVQKRYEECSASHDPNTIVMLVNKHPYHIDSLLTLAELYRQMGESQRSADLLEKCLYALEYAWHPGFSITTGRCRLDYGWDPNKPLFVALFKHMQHLYRRGCHRTALEVCKLLLSLDPDDPLGSMFCIDYFAIRAEQYKWLQRFVREYGADRSLSLLPSFSFSLALAQFHIEAQGSASSTGSRKSSGKSSLPNLPEASHGEIESSLGLLQQALMLHPAVLKRIVDKAPIKEDAAWTNILKHHHFSKATSDSPSLEHLMNIYIARNYLVWRAPDVQAWLKEGAQAVVNNAERARTGSYGGEIADWACVRKEAFRGDQNEYRHLLVSDFSDSAATLPQEELQQFGFGLGLGNGAAPMRPENAMAEAAVQGRELEGRNSLMLFFQSFLPWFNHGVDLHGQDPRLQG